MIHLVLWLADHAGLSFALFVGISLSLVAWFAGALGRVLLVALTVGSAAAYVAPDASQVALGYFGLGLTVTLAVVVVVRLAHPLTTRDRSSYVKAVTQGKTAEWWRPTLLDRLFDPNYLKPWPDDPTVTVDEEAVAALHAMYAARRAATGDPLKAPPPSVHPPVAPPNATGAP